MYITKTRQSLDCAVRAITLLEAKSQQQSQPGLDAQFRANGGQGLSNCHSSLDTLTMNPGAIELQSRAQDQVPLLEVEIISIEHEILIMGCIPRASLPSTYLVSICTFIQVMKKISYALSPFRFTLAPCIQMLARIPGPADHIFFIYRRL